MPIAVNATRRGTSTTNVGGVCSIALTSTPTAGCTLLLSVAVAGNTTTITGGSIRDPQGNAWVQLADGGNQSNGVRVFLLACLAQNNLKSGDSVTFTISPSVVTCMALDEVTGLGTLHAPDQTTTGASTTNTTSVATGTTGTTAYANELVWVVVGTPTTSTTTQSMTAGATYTQQGSRITTSNLSLYAEYKVVAATGTQTAAATLVTTAAPYSALLVTLPDPQSPESTRRAVSGASTEVATTGANRAVSGVGAEVAATGPNVAASYVGIEVAILPTHGTSFMGAEVATTGANRATSFIGVEVSWYTLSARRPGPMVIG